MQTPGVTVPREEFLGTPAGRRVSHSKPHCGSWSRGAPVCTRQGLGAPAPPANSLSEPIPVGHSDPSMDPAAQSSSDRREAKSPLCSPSDQNILSGEDTALHWLSKAVLGPWLLGSHRDMGGIDPCPLISPDKNLETTRLKEHSCSKPHKDPVSRACWSDGSPTWLKGP